MALQRETQDPIKKQNVTIEGRNFKDIFRTLDSVLYLGFMRKMSQSQSEA